MAFDRLRFDFNFHRPLSEHELREIEKLINQWIGDATNLQTKVMPLADAKQSGAIAMFGEKYGEQACHFIKFLFFTLAMSVKSQIILLNSKFIYDKSQLMHTPKFLQTPNVRTFNTHGAVYVISNEKNHF